MQKQRQKQLYRVKLNHHAQVHDLYRFAGSERQAVLLAIYHVEKLLNLRRGALSHLMHTNSWRAEEVVK